MIPVLRKAGKHSEGYCVTYSLISYYLIDGPFFKIPPYVTPAHQVWRRLQ